MCAKYTLHSYMKFDNNALAKASSAFVATNSDSGYNPLYICGNHGVGKSHLLYAIQTEAKISGKEVLYLDGEWFVKNVVNGIRYGTMEEFRNKYRNVNILLIDNVERIIGRKSSQQELFSTIETLINERKQVVIASQKHPKDLLCTDERLRSRLAMGLVINISDYSEDEKLIIAVSMAKRLGINLVPDLAKDILSQVDNDFDRIDRYLEYAASMNEMVTQNHIRNYFEYDAEEKTNKINCQTIIEVTAAFYNVNADLLKWKNRNVNIVQPRLIAMYLCSEMTNESMKSIANLFNRNHATVKAGIEKVSELKKKDIEISKTIETIVNEIHIQING